MSSYNETFLNQGSLSRRGFIGAISSTMIVPFCASAFAQTTMEITKPEAFFLSLSKTLTGHIDLSPAIAARFHRALTSENAMFPEQLAILGVTLGNADTPEAAMKIAKAANMHGLVQKIISCWYTGSINDDMNAPTFLYYDALMYRPSWDAMRPPTYCIARPGWWQDEPPAL